MMRKIFTLGFLLAIVSAAQAGSTTTYQYKDTVPNTFQILLWSVCGASNQYCTGMVLEDSSGNEKATASNPLRVDPVGTTAQPVSQSGSWTATVVQGTGSNLHMVCDSGCSSSTAPADESTFTFGTTPQSPIGGFFQTTATNNPLTNGQMGAWQFTAQRAGFVNVRNSSGVELGTSSNPFQVTGANGSFPVTQPTAANLNATVVGTGTFAVQATLQASATTAIGKVDPNTIASWGLMSGTTPGTAPTNTLIAGGIYNSSPPSPSSGQTLPIQLGSDGSQLVSQPTASKLNMTEANSGSILSAVQGATPAGSNIIGKVGIDQTTDGTTNGVRATSQYPAGATAVQGSTTGTTSATSATLAATASVTNYVCGFSIRANATAAATGNATLADGTKTFNFTQWTAPLASGLGVTEEIFTPCYPASAVNTAWTLTSAAPGSGGTVSVAIWGYQK